MTHESENLTRVDLNDLPKWSSWTAKMLGLEAFQQPERTQAKIDEEYGRVKWQACLDAWRNSKGTLDADQLRAGYYAARPEASRVAVYRGELVSASAAQIMSWYDDLLVEWMGPSIGNARTVVELGAGFGHILWSLRSRFPGTQWRGGEYTGSAVGLANGLYASHPDISVEHVDFYDAAYAVIEKAEGPVVVLTSQALEQTPDARRTLDTLTRYRDKISAVFHIEPAYDLQDPSTHCQVREAPDGTLRCISYASDSWPDLIEAFALVESATEGSGRMKSLVYRSADGMRQTYGWIDAERGYRCILARTEDGLERCIPSEFLRHTEYFERAGCEGPLYSGSETAADVIVVASDTCPIRARVIQPVPVPSEPVFLEYTDDGGENCEGPHASETPLYAPGQDVPPEELVSARREIAYEDPGRLKPIMRIAEGGCWVDDAYDGSRVTSDGLLGNWYDSELETPCAFRPMNDGLLHCIPWRVRQEWEWNGSWGREYLYSDAGCTQEWATIARSWHRRCPTPRDRYWLEWNGDHDVVSRFDPLDLTSLPQLWSKSISSTVCSAWMPPAGIDLMKIGAEIAPSAFMAAEVEIE